MKTSSGSKQAVDSIKSGMRLNNYILERPIGKGSFSEVWLGRDTRTDKPCAIKKVMKERLKSHAKLGEMLRTEVSIMHTIKHRNIMHLIDFLETPSCFYLILEYLKDGDLESILRKTKLNRVDETTAVFYLKQILNGFQELRDYKIFHRDIKLANLFLDENRLVIGDFGFAKSGVDQTTTILGTPLTMAPELLLNTEEAVKYNSKSDIWSIGVVFYQLLFGQVPFPGSTVNEIRRNIMRYWGANLPIPSNISTESRQLLQQMLDIDPARRIDWPELFSHPVFQKFSVSSSLSKISICPCCRTVGHTNGRCEAIQSLEKTETDFKKNAQNVKTQKDFRFAEDDALVNAFKITANPSVEETLSPEEKLQYYTHEVTEFYDHEQKKTGFVVFTSNLMQSALKRPAFAKLFHVLATGAAICSKKALTMNQVILQSLLDKSNIFKITPEFFEMFCASPDFKRTLEKSQLETTDTEKRFNDCLLATASVTKSEAVKKVLENPKPKLSDIDLLLRSVVKHLSAGINLPELRASPDDLKLFFQIVFCIKCSDECQIVFNYEVTGSQGKKFSWIVFSAAFDNFSLEDFQKFFNEQKITQEMIANWAI